MLPEPSIVTARLSHRVMHPMVLKDVDSRATNCAGTKGRKMSLNDFVRGWRCIPMAVFLAAIVTDASMVSVETNRSRIAMVSLAKSQLTALRGKRQKVAP